MFTLMLPGWSSGQQSSAYLRARNASAATTPPPPSSIVEPDVKKAVKALRAQSDRSATMLTGPSGLLGDPPLDRPMARSPSVLGG